MIFLLELFLYDIDRAIHRLLILRKTILHSILLTFDLRFFSLTFISIRILNERYYLYQIYIFLSFVLSQSGDIETNPGPVLSSNQGLSFFHWNLNSLSVNNFIKKDLVIAFNTIHKYDILCLSETYLDSSYALDDNDLQIDNYTMIRADHPMDIKRGGVCLYYRDSLAATVLNFSRLSECIILEIEVDKKKIILLTLYRSPSQSPDTFAEFLENFENDLNSIYTLQPFLIIALGDFNAKSSNWCPSDSSSNEGIQIDSIASLYGLHQLISEPTHILPNSSSCIDLIFTSQPNLLIQSGVLP